MPNKSNQKRPELKSDKIPVVKQIDVTPKEASNNDDETPKSFSTTLNEELDEHLKKNSKRFFGGCG